MRRFALIVLFLMFLLGALSLGGGDFLQAWSHRPISKNIPQDVKLSRDVRLLDLSKELASLEVIDSAYLFYIFVRINSDFRKFQAGNYRFIGDNTPQMVVEKMVRGDVYREIALQITIPEGFNIRQIKDRLVALRLGSDDQIHKLMTNRQLLTELKVSGKNFEGYLYPATYTFSVIPQAEEVVRKMVETFWKNVPKNYTEKISALGLSLEQAVTFASLIEAETASEGEKSKIAEVIWNRLKKSEPLGIDAAVIYGVKGYDGDLKKAHLKDKKNPFNTRIHKGLPPGPICSPTLTSLKAVLNPTKAGYYYYVLVPNQERAHHFSSTLDEHNQYVRALVQKQKKSR